MTNENGLSVFELLSDLDDDLVAAAVLPEDGVGAAPTRRGRGLLRIPDFMNNGWVAAVLSVVVALSVLGFIIRAGQMHGKNEADNALSPSYGLEDEPSKGDDVAWKDMEDAVQDGAGNGKEPGEVAEGVTPELDAPESTDATAVTVTCQPFSLSLTPRRDGYMLWDEVWYDGGMVCAEGMGAEGRLLEIRSDLKTLTVNEHAAVSVTLSDESETLLAVTVCNAAGERIAHGVDASILSELAAGEYFVVLSVKSRGSYIPEADTYETNCYEYAFILNSLRADVG